MKTKIKNRLLNRYFRYPIIFDFIITLIILIIICYFKSSFKFKNIGVDSFLSNIISTIVSFAGFILASLTIIVTVKANIKVKNLEDAANGLELLLLSKDNYRLIISAFRDAIIELVICLILVYTLWMPMIGLNIFQLSLLSVYALLVIFFTLFRSLLILFRIIFLEIRDET